MKITFEDKTLEAIDVLAGVVTKDNEELQFTFVVNPTITFDRGMQLIQTMTLNLFQAFIEANQDNAQEVREALYDAYNIMASSLLNQIIPDKELREDLDEKAILKTQEEIVENLYNNMTPEEKEAALANINTMRERLIEDIRRAETGTTTDTDNSAE